LILEKENEKRMAEYENTPESSAQSPSPNRREALAYGAAFVPVFGSRSWEEAAELVRNAWASRFNQVG